MLKRASILICFCMTTIAATIPDLAELNRMIARFAPATLTADTSKLSPGDKQALAKLLDAARLIDDNFQVQHWNGNPELKAKLRSPDQNASGQGSLSPLSVEQWALVGSGRSCGVHPRSSAGKTAWSKLLSA